MEDMVHQLWGSRLVGPVTLLLFTAMLIGFCTGYSFRSWMFHRAQRRARAKSLQFIDTMISMVGELTPPRGGQASSSERGPPSISSPPIVPANPVHNAVTP